MQSLCLSWQDLRQSLDVPSVFSSSMVGSIEEIKDDLDSTLIPCVKVIIYSFDEKIDCIREYKNI